MPAFHACRGFDWSNLKSLSVRRRDFKRSIVINPEEIQDGPVEHKSQTVSVFCQSFDQACHFTMDI